MGKMTTRANSAFRVSDQANACFAASTSVRRETKAIVARERDDLGRVRHVGHRQFSDRRRACDRRLNGLGWEHHRNILAEGGCRNLSLGHEYDFETGSLFELGRRRYVEIRSEFDRADHAVTLPDGHDAVFGGFTAGGRHGQAAGRFSR